MNEILRVVGGCALIAVLLYGLVLVTKMGEPRRGSTNVNVHPEDPEVIRSKIRANEATARLRNLEADKLERDSAPPRFHQIHARPIPKHSGRPEIGRGR